MDIWNRLTNHTREYWYMGSMLGRSVVEKKSTEPCSATGLYPARDCSIFFSVSSATFCFLLISFDRAFEESRI